VPIKYFVLVLLTVQNAGAVLMMRYARSMPGEGLFVTQTAVIMQELIKGITCVGILIYTEGNTQSAYAVPVEAAKTAIPALLYLCQNNLQYLGVGLLDAATYTVTYQTKILFSGMLSVVILGRVLTPNKWLGIMLIAGGVAVVNLAAMGDDSEKQAEGGGVGMRTVGLLLILAAACFSSLAGVSFEKFLKGVKISLWARNLQLAFYSLVIGLVVAMLSSDGAVIQNKGFFYGYTMMTWGCILMNAFGGLLVGATIKYADAILKDVALGLSIVLSTFFSAFIFNFEISGMFLFGMLLVIYAAVLYGGNVTCFGLVSTTAPTPPAPPPAADTEESVQLMDEEMAAGTGVGVMHTPKTALKRDNL